MNISLRGWIRNIQSYFNDLQLVLAEITEDYHGEKFDELVEKQEFAQTKAYGFMHDMSNIFSGLKELKTEQEKAKWVDNIKQLLCVEELQYCKYSDCLLKRKGDKE